MSVKSPVLTMFLEPLKDAAGEGAALELKMRLLAGKIPALQNYTHKRELGEIETDLLNHFDASLSPEEKETLRLCRQLRNKVLHSDFRAARDKLKELGFEPGSGGVVKIDLPVPPELRLRRKFSVPKRERKARLCLIPVHGSIWLALGSRQGGLF